MPKGLSNTVLAGQEAEAAIRRRRAWLLAIIALGIVVLIGGGRRMHRWINSARAAQFAMQGDHLAAEGKMEEAIKRYQVALQLAPTGYRELQGAARLADLLNRPRESVALWQAVIKLPGASDEDRQACVRSLLNAGDVTAADPVLRALLKDRPDAETFKLAARSAHIRGDSKKATEFARVATQKAPGEASAEFELAQLLAASGRVEDHAEARRLLWHLTETKNPYQAQAVRALAAAQELNPEERVRVLAVLEANPAPDVVSSLLAFDLRLQLHPEDQKKILDEAVARWNGSGTDNLVALARWLNLHGEAERVLSLCSLESALTNRDLLLCRLDALASQQRWNDIDETLHRGDLTLDSTVLECFRARASQERNNSMDAEIHWNHALALASKDPGKLRFVANFAEQSHAGAVALKALDQLAKIPQYAVSAYLATEKLSAMNVDTAVQRDAAEKVAGLSPNDPNAADQLAYLNLLLNRDVKGNAQKAKELAQKNPSRLSYRVTAALGYLRMKDPGPALAEFQPPPGGPAIDWENTPAGWRAVYAAVLMANEKMQEADEILKNIPRDRLGSEERQLIEARKDPGS